MKSLKILRDCLLAVIWAILFLLFNGGKGWTATLYVHPTEGLYRSIGAAVNAAANGDTILVAPGTYPGVNVNKLVYIRSERGPEVTKIVSPGEYGILFENTNNSSITGFYIKGTSYGVFLRNNSTGSSSCRNINIKNNIIEGCGRYGIYLYAVGKNSPIEYTTIENNTISGNGADGIRFWVKGYDDIVDKANYIRDCFVSNNIIANNGSYGVVFTTECAGKFENNNFFNNSLFGHPSANNSGVSISAVNGNIFVDPLFVDATTGNYMLLSNSPCIDAGRIGVSFNDPDGTRNNMGAYGGPGAASFWPYPKGGPVVTNLSVTPASVPQGGTITIKATGSVR